MRTPGVFKEKLTTNLGNSQWGDRRCSTCGQPLGPHPHLGSAHAEDIALETLAANYDEISKRLTTDPEFARQIEALTALSLTDYADGADLTHPAYQIATHPLVLAMLRMSDRFVRELGGRADLVRRRRRGVIRRVFPPDEALPIAKPPISAPDREKGTETRYFPLLDELEWLRIEGYRDQETGLWRPKSDTITLKQARAILGWKATRFDRRRSYSWTPGGNRGRGGQSSNARIDTEDFMNWSVVKGRR